MTITIPDKEADAVIDMARDLNLTATQIVIQAIRLYQLLQLGHVKVISNPPVGCPDVGD